MIRIIKGNYGLVKNGTVVQMLPGSEPFNLNSEREKELISLGVAERVNQPQQNFTKEKKNEKSERADSE